MSWTRKSLCYTLFQSSPFLESSQWSLSEILGRCPTECAHNSPTRLPTARQAQETAVPCGMSTHGRWAGPARRSLLFCPSEHTDTGQVRAPTPPRRRRPRADIGGQPPCKPSKQPTWFVPVRCVWVIGTFRGGVPEPSANQIWS